MVVFELMSKEEDKIVYKYYPENHTDKKSGLISIRPSTSEYELEPAEEEWYQYVDHAIRRILEEYEKGNIPEKGTVAWY